MGGLGVHLMSALLKFDHLLAEGKSLSAVHDGDLHAEDLRIKVNGDVDAGDREDDVVERIYGYGHIRGIILAHEWPLTIFCRQCAISETAGVHSACCRW